MAPLGGIDNTCFLTAVTKIPETFRSIELTTCARPVTKVLRVRNVAVRSQRKVDTNQIFKERIGRVDAKVG